MVEVKRDVLEALMKKALASDDLPESNDSMPLRTAINDLKSILETKKDRVVFEFYSELGFLKDLPKMPLVITDVFDELTSEQRKFAGLASRVLGSATPEQINKINELISSLFTDPRDEMFREYAAQKYKRRSIPLLFNDRCDFSELSGLNIIDFLRVVYATSVKTGKMSRARFRQIDPEGEMALRNWLRNNQLPPDVVLPTRSASVDDPAEVKAARREVNAYNYSKAKKSPTPS